jgi:hypothetical protein
MTTCGHARVSMDGHTLPRKFRTTVADSRSLAKAPAALGVGDVLPANSARPAPGAPGSSCRQYRPSCRRARQARPRVARVDVRERLAIGVPLDVAARDRVSAPGREKSAGCHRGRGGWSWYGLHLTGVTSSGVPFLELIQPLAVRRHGHRSVYGPPRPSVTCSAMSSSSGALSIGFQP